MTDSQQKKLSETIKFRLFQFQLKEAKKIIRHNKDKYENLSHFARVAFFKLLREETKRGERGFSRHVIPNSSIQLTSLPDGLERNHRDDKESRLGSIYTEAIQ